MSLDLFCLGVPAQDILEDYFVINIGINIYKLPWILFMSVKNCYIILTLLNTRWRNVRRLFGSVLNFLGF